MCGMCGLIVMKLSFNFRESNAIFTDLSHFTNITVSDTKRPSSTSLFFQIYITFYSSRPTYSCRCSGTSLVFCLTGCCPSFNWMCISVSFIVSSHSNKSGYLLNTFSRSDWLFAIKLYSAN